MAYTNRGVCYYHLGDYDEAIDNFTRALSINQNFQPAIVSMKAAYEAKAGRR